MNGLSGSWGQGRGGRARHKTPTRKCATWGRGPLRDQPDGTAIPLDQSLIYVQPLYLAASEQGALPELRRVIVAHGNQIAMEPTLQQSLARIFGGRAPGPVRAAGAPPPTALDAAATRQFAQQAWEIWNHAQEALRRGDWATYGTEQKRLEETLRSLTQSK